MKFIDKLQENNTCSLKITYVNSFSNYIEPKGKLNSDSNTNHSELKLKKTRKLSETKK